MMNNWKILPEGNGTRLAIDGQLAAAASLSGIVIWKGEEKIVKLDMPFPLPGFPSIIGNKIFWGDGYYDLTTGQFQSVSAMRQTMSASADFAPGDNFIPIVYAWDKEGKIMTAAWQWSGIRETRQSQVIMINTLTGTQKIIWQERNAPPSDICVSRSAIILGTHDPSVYDHEGNLKYSLPLQAPPFRLCCTDDEKLLMTAGHGMITLWKMDTGDMYRQWPGHWLDASLSPNGQYLAMTDFDGTLHVVHPYETNMEPEQIKPPDPVQSLTLGNETVIASFFTSRDKIRTTNI